MKTVINEIEHMFNLFDNNELENYIKILSNSYGKTIVGIGAGRMGYSLRAHIMRLSHIGYKAYFIGDTSLPRIDKDSIVIINTSSGETPTNILYAKQAVEAGSTIITFTCNKDSTIAKLSDHVITIPVINTQQIMKSIWEQFTYLLLDSTTDKIIDSLNLQRSFVINNHSILE